MAIPNFPWPRLESSTIIVQFFGKSYFILDPNSLIYIPYPRVNCLKTIPFTAAHYNLCKAHSEVEREVDFSPVFPNLPDASQKSISKTWFSVSHDVSKISCCQYSSQSADIAISFLVTMYVYHDYQFPPNNVIIKEKG